MPSFLLYEGASDDPMRQTMRLVDGESLDEVWARFKDRALSVQEYVSEPIRQEPLDERKARRGMIVQP